MNWREERTPTNGKENQWSEVEWRWHILTLVSEVCRLGVLKDKVGHDSGTTELKHAEYCYENSKARKYPLIGFPVVTGLSQLKHVVFTRTPNILIYDPQKLNTYLFHSIYHMVPLVSVPVYFTLLCAPGEQRPVHLGQPSVYRAPCVLQSESSINTCGVNEQINK